MKTNFSLLFFIKKPKNYQSGPAPIYTRIKSNGKRSETSTGQYCDPKHWNSNFGRMQGKKDDIKIKSLNASLDEIQNKIYSALQFLQENNQEITAENIRNQYIGKPTSRPFTLVEVFNDHNEKMRALIGKEYTKGTHLRYVTSLKHTVAFLKWKFKIKDIELNRIDHSFIMDYEFYLRSVRNCANNSAVKYIRNFGKIIHICVANQWINHDPFLSYKSKFKKVERIFLTKEELQRLADKEFEFNRLAYVRDVFLFCCFTGLAYVDVKQLRKQDIVIGIDGEKWISIKRQKTNVPSKIPILPMAIRLLNKYENHPQCEENAAVLPVLSNQKMNAYLKEVTDLCGVHKNVTFHIARHTFATTVTLLNGVPIETVSKMLGHTNIKTTQHYAKILDIKVSADMKTLKERIEMEY
ncbi:site-specific integrase [Pedobacter arcticus]|uniref:site-specific integrase n=1 Tax=Pedobacter arcticus TaxID=752140 RepID=UPI0002FC5477|nr:site-specific integrase [Pedobacter arcticus]